MIYAPDIKVLSGLGHIFSFGAVWLHEMPDCRPTGTAPQGGGAYNRDGGVTVKSNGVLLRLGRQDFPALLHESQQLGSSGAQIVRELQELENGLWSAPNTTQQYYNRAGKQER